MKHTLTDALRLLVCALLACAWLPAAGQVADTGAPMLFEGARLIPGDGSPAVEDSAFLVEDGRFTSVGRRGELDVPDGAARVDLSGKTVMPALIELHSHIGYWRGLTNTVENYSRANIVDHLERFAYHGVAAAVSMGTDRRELSYAVRDELRENPPPDAARYFSAGQGISAPDAGPGFPMRPAVYEVTTEAEARIAVRELAAKGADRWIKLWHDAGRGVLPPPVLAAVIDEAHRQELRVVAHVRDLADAKYLIRAGLDGFAHAVWRDGVDDELVALLREHPNVFTLTTFWADRNRMYGATPSWIGEPLLSETFKADEIAALVRPNTPADAPERWAASRTPSDVMRLVAAGVRIGLGGDVGGISGAGYFGFSSLMELESLVRAGLTPLRAISAATHDSAEILGLDDLGSVAAGNSADFIVLDANPLDDIANTRRIAQVFLRGHEVDRARLRARWTGSD